MLVLVTFSLTCLIVLAKPDREIFEGSVNDISVPQTGIKLGFIEFLIVGPIVVVIIWAYLHAFLSELRRNELTGVGAREPVLPVLSGPLPALMTWFVEIPLVPTVVLVFAFKAGFLHWMEIWCAGAAFVCLLAFGGCAWRNVTERHWAMGLVYTLLLATGLYASLLPRWPNLAPAAELRDALRLNLKGLDLGRLDLCGDESMGKAGVNFSSVRLSHADLSGALVSCADFTGSDAADVDFSDADLRNAKLETSNLLRANFVSAKLGGANLRSAFLMNADLTFATLQKADLSEADLSGAQLSGADMSGADLSGAKLTTALSLTQEQVNSACHQIALSRVDLPEGFDQPPECPKPGP